MGKQIRSAGWHTAIPEGWTDPIQILISKQGKVTRAKIRNLTYYIREVEYHRDRSVISITTALHGKITIWNPPQIRRLTELEHIFRESPRERIGAEVLEVLDGPESPSKTSLVRFLRMLSLSKREHFLLRGGLLNAITIEWICEMDTAVAASVGAWFFLNPAKRYREFMASREAFDEFVARRPVGSGKPKPEKSKPNQYLPPYPGEYRHWTDFADKTEREVFGFDGGNTYLCGPRRFEYRDFYLPSPPQPASSSPPAAKQRKETSNPKGDGRDDDEEDIWD